MIKTIEALTTKDNTKRTTMEKLAFVGIDLANCSSNEFAIKNGWRKADANSLFGESFSSFEVAYGFDYNRIVCRNCSSVFNSPLDMVTCIVCSSKEIQVEKKHIKKPVLQESMVFQPDLFKQAVDDIEKHPVKTESFDWQHLADTIGD